VQNGFDAHLLLHQQAKRLVAHTCRGARAVGNVDGVDADRLQVASAFQFPLNRRPRGGMISIKVAKLCSASLAPSLERWASGAVCFSASAAADAT